MPSWETLIPLIADDDSGEPYFGAYDVWFFPQNVRMAVTRSQYEVLKAIIDLHVAGKITRTTALLSEAAFATQGWVWIDQPAKLKREQQAQQLMMTHVLKK